MEITRVCYRKLVSGPGYNNQSVEAEAKIVEGDNPADVLLELSLWVRSQLGETPTGLDHNTLREEVDCLYRQRQQLRRAVAQAEARATEIREDIEKLAIKREELGGEPVIPF